MSHIHHTATFYIVAGCWVCVCGVGRGAIMLRYVQCKNAVASDLSFCKHFLGKVEGICLWGICIETFLELNSLLLVVQQY